MNRGYRKFGGLIFRPVCSGCDECRPIRIPVERFRPDRSQRRAWKRNEGLRRATAAGGGRAAPGAVPTVPPGTVAAEGLAGAGKGRADYAFSFVRNPVPSVEISLWEGDALRAVVLTDVTPNVVSGIYHYYDPGLYGQGIGTCCMLHTIELARELGKAWAYFGFYVAGCGSLAYKARFRPCEIMGLDENLERSDCRNERARRARSFAANFLNLRAVPHQVRRRGGGGASGGLPGGARRVRRSSGLPGRSRHPVRRDEEVTLHVPGVAEDRDLRGLCLGAQLPGRDRRRGVTGGRGEPRPARALRRLYSDTVEGPPLRVLTQCASRFSAGSMDIANIRLSSTRMTSGSGAGSWTPPSAAASSRSPVE